jgi:hypothetical protein
MSSQDQPKHKPGQLPVAQTKVDHKKRFETAAAFRNLKPVTRKGNGVEPQADHDAN